MKPSLTPAEFDRVVKVFALKGPVMDAVWSVLNADVTVYEAAKTLGVDQSSVWRRMKKVEELAERLKGL